MSEELLLSLPAMAAEGVLLLSVFSISLFGEVQVKTIAIRLRGEVPEQIYHLLNQEKFIGGKSKQQVMSEALALYFDQKRRPKH